MLHQPKSKIKALILLTGFSLNTIIGFACSLGVDMGFNSKDYHNEEATEAVVHIHADGKRHIHYEKKEKHNHGKSHHPERPEDNHNSKEGKNNCCNDQVLKFQQLDKSIPYSLNITHPIFLIAFFDAFYNVALPTSEIVKNIKQFVRSYHPPIPDIRIAIQSFQI